MATKLYTEDIDKTFDWGGDEKTNGLPVSGEKVQKFIKESLAKKFGYLYYDKDKLDGFEEVTGTNKYLIFADQDDYNLWASNPSDNMAKVLFNFDAPAPATVVISDQSKQVNTVLLSEVGSQKLSFKYLVKDSSDHVQPSRMSLAMTVNNNVSGVQTLPTQYLDMVYGDDPISYEFEDLGNYLLEGVNTITITLTALSFNVSATIIYQYRVLNLAISSTFDVPDPNGFYYYNGIPLDDVSNPYFGTTITAIGTGAKYLRTYIDGVNVDGAEVEGETKPSRYIGSNSPQNYDLNLQFDKNGTLESWATPGKHNIQFYFFVLNENNEEIKSQTLYYDFVLTKAGMDRGSYVLFTRTLDQGALVGQDDVIKITTEQYQSMDVEYAVYDTSGRGNSADGSSIIVDLVLKDKATNAEVASTQANVPSGTTSSFNYTFQTYGTMTLSIINTVDGGETVVLDVNVTKSSVEISEAKSNMVLKLSALNRSNNEPEARRNVWEYVYVPEGTSIERRYAAQFENVLWNSQNGWLNNTLTLNNGATVTIPINIFSLFNSGLTFEIDFETANVQDDDAAIMHYGEENGAHIFINACNAELRSNNNVSIHTNYKDGARQKIQFIFNGNTQAAENSESPYLMYIVVNGILDRAAQFTSSDSLGTDTPESFTIGNTDGKATVKIHSMRIYRRALTLDECVDNYIADSSDIRRNYLRNDIYSEGTTIDVDKILNGDINVPVMIIYGDVMTSIVQVFNKKSNVPVDILYQDPSHPEFNYFAYDAWMSNQGTSSMNYPRRNFRLYFNKNNDSTTLRGYASNDHYKYQTRVYQGLTDQTLISQIQSGQLDLSQPVGGIVPMCNKKWQEEVNGSLTTIDKLENYYEVSPAKARMYWHSGIKLFTKSDVKDEEGNVTGYKFDKVKNLNKEINAGKTLYSYGGYARYKEKDLYTDRWTIKCDYAESSMTHNAGVGRLWNNVMRDVEVGDGGFSNNTDGERYNTSTPCRTNAQAAALQYKVDTGLEYGDIRTSCDGYPIVIVNRPRVRDNEGNFIEGQFGDPIFLGLYNIMTDKGSTPLFGFEDLKDDDGNVIFDASHVECWECLQNGSALAQMSNIITDDTDGSDVGYSDDGSDNEDRPLFKTYEARWPDNDDLNDTLTNNLETLIRFVNFCKDAVTVEVGGKDGYTLSDFTEISEGQAEEYSEHLGETIDGFKYPDALYIGVPSTSYKDKTTTFYRTDGSGNTMYDDNDKPILLNPNDPDELLLIEKAVKKAIYYYQDYASQNVTGSSFTALYTEDENVSVKVAKVMAQLTSNRPYVFTASQDDTQIEQVEQVYYPNSGYTWYIFDNTYDRSDVKKTLSNVVLRDNVYTGKVHTFDGKRVNSDGDQVNPNAWVTVYLTRNGSNYTYTDEFGQSGVRYASGEDIVTETGSGNFVSRGESFQGKPLMEYFKDKKYDHFDVWKLAAYYVYIMRFAAVDQVIKNTMMTTEDGKHYYFINYDNDTILGVRNDGYLAYDWQVTRETYDYSVGSYAYAGFGSVLWNLLEQDEDFMQKVQTIATAMVSSNVLTYDIALDMFNNKQSGTWSERMYNNSEMYKYIGIFNDIDNKGTDAHNPYQNTKYLPFLQGSRASHRDWWLRHRFDLYDSKWSAGEYATNALEFYMGLTASSSNQKRFLRMVAGSRFYFTIQSNNVTLGNNFVELAGDEEYYFTTAETLILGNPMKMLGTYKVKVLDFSEYRDSLGSSINFNWSEDKGSMLQELIIGGEKTLSEQNGCALQQISNLNRLATLEVLDIRTCYNLSSTPDISKLGNLRQFLASDSNITNFLPAKGLAFEKVSLPSTIQNMVLDSETFDLETEGNYFNYSPNSALKHFEILDCKGLDIIEFLDTWFKALKNDNVLMSQYSCVLSFDKIELPAKVNGKDSIEWLNEIKTTLGKNSSGEDNFIIKKGVIKLYGHSETVDGGLTQEDYELMTSIWPAEWFRADNAVHFDAEKSVFLTVTSPGKHFTDNGDGTYTIVAGQKVQLVATIFPISNERKITFEPYYFDNAVGRYRVWGQNATTGVYSYNYGGINTNSTLSNDNGTGLLSSYEYTDSEKMVRIQLKDSLAAVNDAPTYVDVQIVPIVKPNASTTNIMHDGVSVIGRTVTVDRSDIEYMFDVEFTNNDINCDVKEIIPTFGDSQSQVSNLGRLEGYVNDDGTLQIGYSPIINADGTNFTVTVGIILDDARSSAFTIRYSISLVTTKITEIKIFKKNALGESVELSKNSNDEYVVDNFLTDLNGETTKAFTYDVVLSPSNYNVAIANMDADLSGSYTNNCNVSLGEKSASGEMNQFTINVNRLNNKTSFLDSGYLELSVVDEFGNEVTQGLNWRVGCFYPDEIKIVKNENSIEDATNTDIELLAADDKTIGYDIRVYSKVNNYLYVWGNATDIVSNPTNNPDYANHFIAPGEYSELVLSRATLSVTSVGADPATDMIDAIPIISNYHFTVKTKESNHDLMTRKLVVNAQVTYNGKSNNFSKEITISRSSALAINGLWQNLPVNEVYYMDTNKRFFNTTGLAQELALSGKDVDQLVVCLTYVYEDINTNKKQVSIDPWMLKDGNKYYWHSADSTFYHDGVYGYEYYDYGDYNEYTSNALRQVNGIPNNAIDPWTDPAKLFECMLNLYRFSCMDENNAVADGGVFTWYSDSNRSYANKAEMLLALGIQPGQPNYDTIHGDLHIIGNVTNSDMIFSVRQRYAELYSMSLNGHLLSNDELNIVIQNLSKFDVALRALNSDIDGTSIFDPTAYTKHDDKENVTGYGDGRVLQSKVFWTTDLNQDANHAERICTMVWVALDGSIQVVQNEPEQYISPFIKLDALFGPQI